MRRPRFRSCTFLAPKIVVALLFAIGGLAYAFVLLCPRDIDQSEGRRLALTEVERMCRNDKLDCTPHREIQATDNGRVYLFVYAIPDLRVEEISAIVSRRGTVELGRLPRN